MDLQFMPEDLLLCVAVDLRLSDCKHLRLTCKTLSEVFASVVLKSITINIMEYDGTESYLDQLKLLACGQPKVPTHAIRILHIQSLSPANNPIYGDSNGACIMKPAERIVVGEQISQALLPALQALKEVHTLKWFSRSNDPAAAQRMVAYVASQYPFLRHLDINVSEIKHSMFGSFRDLASIRVLSSTRVLANIIAGISRTIAQSPRLHSLAIGMEPYYGKSNLDHLLAEYPSATSPPLRLSHLELKDGSREYLNSPIALPHLQALTSLHMLTWQGDLCSRYPKIFPVDEFWASVQATPILLERIAVDGVSKGFMNYLKSYSGLKALTYHDERSRNQHSRAEYNTLATIFFQEAILSHRASLEELDILQSHDSFWCFRDEYQSTLAQCSNLKGLCMSMGMKYPPMVVEEGKDPVWSTVHQEVDELYLLLDLVATRATAVQKLTLKPVVSSTHAHMYQLDNAIISFLHDQFVVLLTTSIGRYVPPAACKRLPMLYVAPGRPQRSTLAFLAASSNSMLRYRSPIILDDQ